MHIAHTSRVIFTKIHNNKVQTMLNINEVNNTGLREKTMTTIVKLEQ